VRRIERFRKYMEAMAPTALLLASVQEQCGLEEGELRCIFVEAQPLARSTLSYRVVDGRSGSIEKGDLSIAELLTRHPWNSAA
jgi:hypothetical protein